NPQPAADQVQSQGVDERAFSDAGNAGDADPYRLSGVRQKPGQELFGGRLVARAARFDQGQGAGQDGNVAGPHSSIAFLRRQLTAARTARLGRCIAHQLPPTACFSARARPSRSARMRINSAAASPITVPGPNTAEAPASYRAG